MADQTLLGRPQPHSHGDATFLWGKGLFSGTFPWISQGCLRCAVSVGHMCGPALNLSMAKAKGEQAQKWLTSQKDPGRIRCPCLEMLTWLTANSDVSFGLMPHSRTCATGVHPALRQAHPTIRFPRLAAACVGRGLSTTLVLNGTVFIPPYRNQSEGCVESLGVEGCGCNILQGEPDPPGPCGLTDGLELKGLQKKADPSEI